MNRHPFDPFSFVFGFAFAALGVVLLDTRVDIADLSGRWLLPLPIMFFGLLIGALALNRVRANAEARRTDPWGSEAEDLTREDTLEG